MDTADTPLSLKIHKIKYRGSVFAFRTRIFSNLVIQFSNTFPRVCVLLKKRNTFRQSLLFLTLLEKKGHITVPVVEVIPSRVHTLVPLVDLLLLRCPLCAFNDGQANYAPFVCLKWFIKSRTEAHYEVKYDRNLSGSTKGPH